MKEGKRPEYLTVDALEVIAAELRRIRALREYELGVLTTNNYGDETEAIQIIAGKRIKVDAEEFAEKGTVVYDEDQGIDAYRQF